MTNRYYSSLDVKYSIDIMLKIFRITETKGLAVGILRLNDIPEEHYLALRMELTDENWSFWFERKYDDIIGYVPYQNDSGINNRGIRIGGNLYVVMRHSYAMGHWVCSSMYTRIHSLVTREINLLETGNYRYRYGSDYRNYIERIV